MINRINIMVVRHSERLDDVDEISWRSEISKYSGTRNRKSFINDPPLSSRSGIRYAISAGRTISNIIMSCRNENSSGDKKYADIGSNDPDIVVLYSSRLRRSVQTAHHIAESLQPLLSSGDISTIPISIDAPPNLSNCRQLPILVSSGLATVIPAVHKSKGKFEFASFDELCLTCTPSRSSIRSKPSTISGSCKQVINPPKNRSSISDTQMNSPVFMDADICENPFSLSPTDWEQAIKDSVMNTQRYLAARIDSSLMPPAEGKVNQGTCEAILSEGNSYSPRVWLIIVGHRETIRQLARRRLETPYCCIGMFAPTMRKAEVRGNERDKTSSPQYSLKIELSTVLSHDGETIPQKQRKK